MLNENHLSIVEDEVQKRSQIQENFESHIAQVTKKIDEDGEGENEVVKETRELEEKYESINKEIMDKTQQMDEEIQKKEESSKAIKEQINTTLASKQEDMQSQLEQYKAAILTKQKEEEDLFKILQDYREKYGQMDKALGKSRLSFKQYDKQIKLLDQQIQLLQQQKVKLTKTRSKKKKGVD